jgi:hypothetical protein
MHLCIPKLDGLKMTQYNSGHLSLRQSNIISAHEKHIYEKLTKEDGALTFFPKSKFSLDNIFCSWLS